MKKYTKEELMKMTPEARTLYSIVSKEKKEYNTSRKQSDAKLGIRDEDGWTQEMRRKYYDMMNGFDKGLQKADMTVKENRKNPDRGKIKDGKASNHAKLIWSDKQYEDVRNIASQLIRFCIEEDEIKKQSGFKTTEEDPEQGFKEITRMRFIKSTDIDAFLKNKKEQGVSPKTLQEYRVRLSKMAEVNVNDGIKSHAKLIKERHHDLTKEYFKEWVGAGNPSVIRGRGEDGKKGYKLKEAEKIIGALEHDPFMKSYVAVKTYCGFRDETINKVEWKNIIDEDGDIKENFEFGLEDKDKFKSGRTQIVLTHETVRDSLKEMWETGLFKPEDKIYGERVSTYSANKIIREACKEAGVVYKPGHEFRAATVEYCKELTKDMSKDEIVKEFLKLANHSYIDKDGKTVKPHNPKVEKMKYVLDKNGNKQFIYKDGKKTDRYKMEKDLDETGHPILEEKFTYDKLITRRRDVLINLFVAQQISHNRPDANAPYIHKDQDEEEEY